MVRVCLLLLLLALVSCGIDARHSINEAEHVLSENPDSALALLRQVRTPSHLPDSLLAKYWLTVAQVHSVKDDALTEDSMVCFSAEYYKKCKPEDKERSLLADRLVAKYYWWKGDKQKARSLMEARMAQSKGDRNAEIGVLKTLYWFAYTDNDFAEAKKYAEQLIEKDKGSPRQLAYRCELGCWNFYLGDKEATMHVFDGIIGGLDEYVKTPVDSVIVWDYAISSYADMLSDFGEQKRAIALQNMLLEHKEASKNTDGISLAYASLSRYYFLSGDLRKANEYYQIADSLKSEALYGDLSNASYYVILHMLLDYADSGKVDFKEWTLFSNSLQDEADRKRKISEAQEAAKRQLVEDNLKLAVARQQEQLWFLSAAVVFAIVVTWLVLYNKRKKRLLAEKKDELDALRRLFAESLQATNKDDRFFKKILFQQLGLIKLVATNPTVSNQQLLKRMTEIVDKKVEVDTLVDWEDLYKTIDYIYDGFYSNLSNKYGELLLEKEMQLCCLLKANFSTKEISIITQQSVRTVYQRKTVVRQKLGMEEKEDIAEWLSEM